MNPLGKTDAIRQKEDRIAELEKQITSRRRVIKSLRTRLTKLQQSIKDMERTTYSKVSAFAEQVMSLQQELKELLEQAMSHKKIFKDKDLRKGAEEMYESLTENDDFIEMLREQQEEAAQFNPEDFADEDGEAYTQDPFAEFRPEVAEEDKRSMRKVYVRLSQAFHPDLARTPEETERNHRLMQRITEAYQRHDVETLLRMERTYLEEAFDPETVDLAERPNLLDGRIERLEQELTFLTQQQGRLSEEIKNTRQSDMGQALTKYDRGNRGGYGFDARSRQMEEETQEMTQIRDELKQAIKAGKMTPKLREMFEPAKPEDLLAQVLDSDGIPPELLELARAALRGEPIGTPLPFQIGEIVSFNRKGNIEPDALTKASQGIIRQIGKDPFSGEVAYGVLPEAAAIEKLSDDMLLDWIDLMDPIPLVWIEEESALRKVPTGKQRTFDPEAAIAVARQRLYTHLFQTQSSVFPPARAERLHDILLSQPQLTDEECWHAFFQEHPWPENLRARLLSNPYKPAPRRLVPIKGINEYDDSDGIIMCYEHRGRLELIPLQYLKFPAGALTPAWKNWISDYRAWADWRLTGYDV